MYTEKELREAVKISRNRGEVLSNLGRNRSGSAYTCLKNNIEKYSIDISHFNKNHNNTQQRKFDWKNYLVFNGALKTRIRTNLLIRGLLKIGRKHVCQECNLGQVWNSKKLTLQIDHIDGNWKNNTPENLRFICPNCHSQQETSKNKKLRYYCFCGKEKNKISVLCKTCAYKAGRPNKRKVIRPDLQQLQEDIKNLGYVGTGKKYSVTDSAIRKWLRYMAD